MSLPENSRLFVGGIPAGTGDADLRRHFCRYGDVADICLPRDRLTGRARRFAFVQFIRPTDAGRALADRHHVINGRQVSVARAEPPRHEEGPSYPPQQRKPLDQRIFWVGKWRYRVGDKLRIALGPLGKNYNQCEYFNRIKGFACVIVDNMLIFDCLIGYISEDSKECLVRWPPEKQTDGSKSAGCSGQGSIRQSCGSLKEYAELSSSSGNIASDATNSPEAAGQSQTWSSLLTRSPSVAS